MTKMTKLIISLAFVFATPLALACDYPAPPKDLPDGTSATKDEMLAGVKMISEYQEFMTAYLSCIEANQVVALQTLGDEDEDAKTRSTTNFDKRYNSAVEEQTKAVEMFNLEIREYKAR
jgi:predicted outer membrane protein